MIGSKLTITERRNMNFVITLEEEKFEEGGRCTF
jgi:hypothetical protein